MKRFVKLTAIALVLASCGDEHNYYPENSSQISGTSDVHSSPDQQSGSQKLNYALLYPKRNNIHSVSFIKPGTYISAMDKRYVDVSVSHNKNKIRMNHIDFPDGTKEIVISGKHIVIDGKNDFQGIFKNLNKQNDISKLIFNVEILDINDSIKIPGAEVLINAKILSFSKEGKLDLTPLAKKTRAEQFQDGAPGIEGAKLSLKIKELNYDKGLGRALFVLKGGDGQDAGLGQEGTQGASLRNLGGGVVYKSIEVETCRYHRDPDDIFGGRNKMNKDQICSTRHTNEGTNGWPGNGGAAQAGGAPGLPGKGGSLVSNIEIESELVDLRGGNSGKAAPLNYKGGAPGNPVDSYHQDIFDEHNRNPHVKSSVHHKTFKGEDAQSPQVVKEFGDAGAFNVVESDLWQSFGYLETAERYANDLYKVNLNDSALKLFGELLENCDFLKNHNIETPFNNDICNRGVRSKQKIVSNLDYFGHGPNWTPNLSLEANYQLYNNEIERSINILYLTYWLMDEHQSLESKQAAVKATQDEYLKQIDDDGKRFNKIGEKIPSLKKKVDDFKVELKQFRDELNQVEAKIIAEARRNLKPSFIKSATKFLAVASNIVPVGQPALTAALTSLDTVVQSTGSGDWQDTIKQIPGVIEAFRPVSMAGIKKEWNRKREKIDYDELRRIFKLTPENSSYTAKQIREKKFDYLKNLKDFTGPVFKGIGKFTEYNKKTRVPKNKLEAEINRIKSIHPLFKELTSKVNVIISKRVALTKEIDAIYTELGNITNNISHSFVTIAKLSEVSSGLEEGIDFRFKGTLVDMENQAKMRLEKYNYLLAKAYQYRMLSYYPGRLDLDIVIEKMKSLVKASLRNRASGNNNVLISEEDFKQIKWVYQDQISKVVQSIVEIFNSGTYYHNNTDRSFSLSKDEIFALNKGKTIYLDLKSDNIFGSGTDSNRFVEDIRINNIEVLDMDFEIEGDPEVIAEGTLDIIYSGQSLIKKDDSYFKFEFGEATSRQKLRWGAKKNILLDEMGQITPSVSDESLLSNLLNTESDIMLFARPGGLTQLKLKLSTLVDRMAKIKLKNASIKINYDYSEK